MCGQCMIMGISPLYDTREVENWKIKSLKKKNLLISGQPLGERKRKKTATTPTNKEGEIVGYYSEFGDFSF